MKQFFFTLILLTGIAQLSLGQKMSWRDYSDIAEKSFKAGDYGTAAKNYKAAWLKKKSKTDLLYKAGQAYYLVKNYKEAANAFEKVSKKSSKYPASTIEYANALKQSGAYEKSIEAYESYMKAYNGDDRPQQQELVNREIEGSKLALRMLSDSTTSAYKISHPGMVINTGFTEYAPVPYGENVLYFSSNRKGSSKIYKSEWDGSSWSKPTVPPIFPKDEKEHFGNGSFSYDFKRFYYTRCKEVETKDGLRAKCDIYVIMRKGDKWGEPIKLRDYINDSVATTTQPSVCKFANKEVLYFSSDRSGGYGGQDIWYCERDLSTDDLDFTVPRNCGPKVNTFMDEVTPWYDIYEGKLYYSSNGQIGAGGLDVCSNMGFGKEWKETVNLGFPVNSPADDFYFIKSGDLNSGYLVSNRIFGDLKKTTDNEDIFRFEYTNFQNLFTGKIFKAQTDSLLTDVRIAVYQLFPDGSESLVDNRHSPDGTFSFALDASKSYRAKVEKFEYAPAFFRFTTSDVKANKLTQNFSLEKEKEASIAGTEPTLIQQPKTENIKKTEKKTPVKEKPKQEPKPAKPEPKAEEPYVHRPPSFIKEGEYYLIQLAAARYPDIMSGAFEKAKQYGTIEHEPVPNQEMERVLLAWWADRKDAIKTLASVKRLGFKDAFVTLHKDGERKNIVK
ncbi:MAG TPA: hypothetical protein PKN57_11240 [Saprospiraceae bacterium]|nr:hypothetical protein [Saprospiraceae bacterium]MCC6688705.1 hypothetical protein [Saprospiraceae bacterium]HMX85334.1 hypothetical protein [Saprospiraceae bacterium]HMZ74174.1 hypothetical protein [Saprospiraceae bacterium]HNA41448.1 hypothetical protein [Saprospiraceae bacterium]